MKIIGVSVLTALSQVYGSNGPQIALEIARRAGLDGIQLVPLRAGWTDENLRNLPPENVISYEGLWKKFPANGLLFNKSLIKKFAWFFPEALTVDLPEGLAEISPYNPYDQFFYENNPAGVVFDSWHIKGLKIKNKKEFVNRLMENRQIKLIHFQTRNKEELKSFLCGGNLGFELFVQVVKNTNCPIIIELPFWWASDYVLSVIGKRIKNL